MKEEVNYAVQKLRDSIASLKEGVEQARDELDKDGVIQRFEFTFELLWKALKIVLEDEGIDCRTPKDCLKEAFRIGLCQDEQVCLDMLEDRNKTSHTYDQAESQKIFQRIKEKYLAQMEEIQEKLEQRQSQRGVADQPQLEE